MSMTPDDFLAWAADPARTLEERYGILRLTEYVYRHHHHGPDKPLPHYESDRRRREARRFNPAYVPQLESRMLEITARLLPDLKELDLDAHGDERPIRDLGFLAFLPGLETLKLGGIEIERLDDLRPLTALTSLHVRSDETEDYSAIAACRELRELVVKTVHPWPVLDGMETLPRLESLQWHGNGRSLAGIPALPALKSLRLGGLNYRCDFDQCLRDFHQLPEMPLLEYFWGGWLYRLDGIERYPRLRFAMVQGHFKSAAPLAGHPSLTHLRLQSERLEDLAPVAGVPALFHFAVLSDRALDWTPLMELDPLREAYHFATDGTPADLGTLRMLLPPAGEIFGLPEPRRLAPLRLSLLAASGHPYESPRSGAFPEGPDGWDGHPGMRQSEIHWVEEHLRQALEKGGWLKLPGVRYEPSAPGASPLFFSEPAPHATRTVGIRLTGGEVIGRLGRIFDCLRRALAGIRHPWHVKVWLQASSPYDDDEPMPVKSYGEEMEEVEREHEFQRKRRQILHDDELRLKLHLELGHDPADFRPTPLPERPEEPDVLAAAEAVDPDESWLPDVEISGLSPEWEGLTAMFTLAEEAVYMTAANRSVKAVAYVLDLVPEYPPGVEPDDA